MAPETRNLIAAMSLSLAILIGWQLYVVEPDLQADRAAYEAQQQAQNNQTATTGQIAQTDVGAGQTPTDTVVQDSGVRIKIEAPQLSGSFSTMGGRLDDVVLKGYYETQDDDASEIHLFKRFDSDSPYFAEFGWVASSGESILLPDESTLWQASSQILSPDTPVTLTYDNEEGLVFSRTFSIDEDYLITVTDNVRSNRSDSITLSAYSLLRRSDTPDTLGLYILHEGPLGVFDETLSEEDYDDVRDAGRQGLTFSPEQPGGWIGITDKYWLAALMPVQSNKAYFSMRSFASATPTGPQDIYQTDMLGEVMRLDPGKQISWQTYLFSGAKKVTALDRYAEDLNITNFDLAIDFGWFYFLTKPFFYAISWLFGMFGNFGLAIIVFTIIVRLLLFPLANKSYKSMAKMRQLSPKIQQMREDYGDDRQRLNKEMMELYKREKVNPAAGCLPILLQIPIFFALYKVLYVSIEMRHAPFYGWIQDLSAVDPTSVFNLFGLLPYSTDFIPQFLSIGVWPILMGISMAVQMRLNPPPPDPIQAKIFQWMPVFFTFLLAGFPAGLVIYWTWNNILSIAQQWWITRNLEKQSNA